VLKWVLAALLAGFIGQFGRSFAVHLMRRRRGKKAAEDSNQPLTHTAPEGQLPPEVLIERERLAAESEARAARAKAEKKRAKAEVKRQKKSRSEDP